MHKPKWSEKPPGVIRFLLILLLVFIGFWSLLFSIWFWEDFLQRVFLTCLVLVIGLTLSLVASFILEAERGKS